jgi:hypothetical protein
MADREWVSAHVFCSDGLDPLLTDAVRPLVGELVAANLVRGCFFLRYWEGGPHLRLRLLPAADNHARVRELVAERCAEHLRRRPSTTPVDARRYAESAARLARYEGLGAYTQTLYPNDSVQFIAYRPEHHRYGHGADLRAVESHFTDSSQIALAVVSAGAAPAARETVAFCAALLARLRFPAAPTDAFSGSFHGPDGLTPAEMDDRYARQRDRLRTLGTRLRAPQESSGAIGAWQASIARLAETLTGRPVESIVDTCVHLFCNRLGVSLAEESYIRYLAARTAADLSGGS